MSSDVVKPDVADRVATIIGPALTAMGYELVRVHLSGGRYQTLQIMAERIDRAEMNVEHCTEISHAISALLDVEDPIEAAYSLEVSSPGIDRPLTRPQDYERFAGNEVSIDTNRPVDGRKRFRGRLLGLAEGGLIRVDAGDGAEFSIPLAEVGRAKLVLTDALLAEALKAQEAAAG